MTEFALATLFIPDGPKAPIHTGRRRLLSVAQPSLRDASCLSFPQSWDAAWPVLKKLAARLGQQADNSGAEPDAQLLIVSVFIISVVSEFSLVPAEL